MDHPDRSTTRLWLWFALTSVACLLILAISPVKDYLRDYRAYQEDYREELLNLAGSSKELREARAMDVEVDQIWIPDFGNRVDRCRTCHLGVGNEKMAGAREPFSFHPVTAHTPHEFARFGCVTCHRGQGRATSLDDAHGDVEDWSSPILPLRYTEASCGVCHEGDSVPEAALLSKGRAKIRKAQCAGCHELRGYEDWSTSAPRLDGLSQKTTFPWLRAWLKNPRALFPETMMPNYQLSDEEATAVAAFLWNQPAVVEVEEAEGPTDGDYDRGKKIFREARCISCHTVEGRGNGSAPELLGIGSKVRASWLLAFLENPHRFQPATEMPRYEFDREELEDLVTYMMDELVDFSLELPDESTVRFSPGLLNDGEKLFDKYGCRGCHRLGGEGGDVRIGPSLLSIGSKPVSQLDFGSRADLQEDHVAWLREKVANPRSFRKDLRMPEYGFGEDELTAIVMALLAQTDEEIPADYRVEAPEPSYDAPGRFGVLVDRYRCLSCHQVQGAGGDISMAPLTAEGSKVRKEWLQRYMLLPTTIRPILTDRMIPLGMNEEDAAFIAEFIENVYVDDSIPGNLFPDGAPAERAKRGRSLFHQRYGCLSCHQVEQNGGYYGPPLEDSPDKLKSGWIAWWLQGPQRWRPDVRCPNFGMSEEDATDIAAYLISLDRPAPEKGGE